MFRSNLIRRTTLAKTFALLAIGCGGMEVGEPMQNDTATAGKGDSAQGGLSGTNATAAQAGPLHIAIIDAMAATVAADGTPHIDVTYTRGCNEAFVELVGRQLPA